MRLMKRGLMICSLLSLCLAGTTLSACKKNSTSTASSNGAKATTSAGNSIKEAKEKALGNAGADSGKFAKSLEKKPCELLTKAMVSKTFGVPAGKLNATNVMGQCEYSWDDQNTKVSATLSQISVFDSAKAANDYFNNATRDMSAKDVSNAMNKVKAQANKGGKLDTASKKQAAHKASNAIAGRGGISFEKVDGLGANARLDKSDVTLVVQKDNLYFHLRADHGSKMPAPKDLSLNGMKKAAAAWHKKTAPRRKKAVVALASPVIKHLDSLAK